MKNCGQRFHNEVGKYRFLNELIKVVSPKVRNLQIGFLTTQIKGVLPAYNYLFFPSTWAAALLRR